MKRRILAGALLFATLFTFTACGNKKENNPIKKEEEKISISEAEPQKTAEN